MNRAAILVTPLAENQYVRIAVIITVSVCATVHMNVVSVWRTVAARWRIA